MAVKGAVSSFNPQGFFLALWLTSVSHTRACEFEPRSAQSDRNHKSFSKITYCPFKKNESVISLVYSWWAKWRQHAWVQNICICCGSTGWLLHFMCCRQVQPVWQAAEEEVGGCLDSNLDKNLALHMHRTTFVGFLQHSLDWRVAHSLGGSDDTGLSRKLCPPH